VLPISQAVLIVIGAVVGLALGYLLNEWRWRKREDALVAAVATTSGNIHPLTLTDIERLSTKVSASILGSIGTVRREVGEVTALLARLEVLIKDSIGRTERIEKRAEQERAFSDDAKHRMHAEIQSLHKAIGALNTAATGIQSSINSVEKWIEKWT
jgi:hypothetical protein